MKLLLELGDEVMAVCAQWLDLSKIVNEVSVNMLSREHRVKCLD